MHQKDNVAPPGDDENLQHLMLKLTMLFICMGIIAIISCISQIKKFQSIRRKHSNESTLQSATLTKNQTEDVHKMKTATEISRADINDSLKREVEELRAFQQEVREELGALRTALTVLSQRRQGEVSRPGDAESQRKGKTE